MSRKFVNTDLLREPALHYLKHGHYIDAPQGTKKWKEYWRTQRERCLEGYSAGGLRITGYHYYYLNFCRMDRVVEDIDEIDGGMASLQKRESFPAFWDWDYNYFWALHIARYGMSEDDYKDLDLDIDILDLSGGKHLVVVKGRRKGYSYKAGSMMARNFCMKRNSKNYAMAFEGEQYLLNDGLLSKTWDNIDFIDGNTPFRQPRLVNRKMQKRSGYKKNIGGTDVEMGTKNEVIGVSLKDDPQKARGKGGELGFFEEAGKFPGLLTAWEVCKPSYEQGAYTTGIMVAYGTGGTEEGEYESLERLFYNPDSYDVLPIRNMWDEGADGNSCGFFVPAYVNMEGYMDSDGNSNKEGAKEYLQDKRESKRSSIGGGGRELEQYIAEHPFNPREATLRVSSNIFPTGELQAHLDNVLSKERFKSLTSGTLYRAEEGVKFSPDAKAKPIFNYPPSEHDDLTGAVVIKEAPHRNREGQIPNNLYTICHDPYAHDGVPSNPSLGVAYVIKRTNNLSTTYNNSIVASYIARPHTQDEYNDNLFKLADYYNARIGFENDRGDVLGYAKRFKYLSKLEGEARMTETKKTKSRSYRSTTRNYGISMSSKSVKNQAQIYLRDWLLEPMGKYEDGSTQLKLHTILDPGLLTELIKYNDDGNFDRVSALFVGMYYLKEKEAKGVSPDNEISKDVQEFFDRDLFSKGVNHVYS